MKIEEVKKHIGAEVELLEHTKPYMRNKKVSSVANFSEKNPSKLIIDSFSDENTVTLVSPEKHLYILNPEHIALKENQEKEIKLEIKDTPANLQTASLVQVLKIKKIALDSGFKLKQQPDQTMDLNPYVYKFAENLINDFLGHNKPVNEWNLDDAFYANNHGEEVEVFYDNEWVLLDEMMVAIARGCNKFRLKPKQIFLNAGNYSKEDFLKIISENFIE